MADNILKEVGNSQIIALGESVHGSIGLEQVQMDVVRRGVESHKLAAIMLELGSVGVSKLFGMQFDDRALA